MTFCQIDGAILLRLCIVRPLKLYSVRYNMHTERNEKIPARIADDDIIIDCQCLGHRSDLPEHFAFLFIYVYIYFLYMNDKMCANIAELRKNRSYESIAVYTAVMTC